jgi:hypothetical protein
MNITQTKRLKGRVLETPDELHMKKIKKMIPMATMVIGYPGYYI